MDKIDIDMFRNMCQTILTILVTTSAFMIGFYIGQEKICSKISNFQEDTE